VERWSRPVTATSLEILRTHLQQPLTEEEKIPIPQRQFDKLCVPYSSASPENALSPKQASTLFRVSTDEDALSASNRLLSAIDFPSPRNGTEDRFHTMWDKNISEVLHLILSEAMPIRNSNKNTSTALKLPDYGFLFKNHCVLRGEEKGTDTAGDPKRELVDKLKWIYHPLPYILGL
jgi:hypothetical protein